MLIDVIPHSLLAQESGTLTYRIDEPAVPGQLVLIPLRRRTIPGIVLKCNVPAGTSSRILSVKRVSPQILPPNYLKFLFSVARYYCITPAQAWRQLAPQLNSHYLFNLNPPSTPTATKLFISPSLHSPAVKILAKQYRPVTPVHALDRQKWWRLALAGQTGPLYGQLSIFGLPYRTVNEVIIDQPYSSTYQSDRSPGFRAPVLGCLLAKSYDCPLIIRSVLPLSILSRSFPLPEKLTVINPTLKPIRLLVSQSNRYLNANLLAELKEYLRTGKKLQIIDNRTGKTEQTKTELNQLLGSAPPVSTMAALYQTVATDQFVILNFDRLWSSNAPNSLLSALEAVGILASRAPVLLQSFSADSSINRLLTAQLTSTSLAKFVPPQFEFRIISLKPRRKLTSELITQTQTQLHDAFGSVSNEQNGQLLWLLAPKQLGRNQHALLLKLNHNWRLMTDASSFPLAKGVDNP